MKIKRICCAVVLCIAAICAVLASGCVYSGVKQTQGVWKAVIPDDGSVASYAIDYAEITVDKTLATIILSYSEVCEETYIESGIYEIADYDCRSEGVSFNVCLNEQPDGGREFRRVDVYDGKLVLHNVHVGFSADVGEYRAGIIYECELEFTKQGGNSEPVKPDVNTKFQDVSQSYRREGYETDFDGGNVDASIAAAISAMREAYSKFGYTMEFIGKNFDDIAKAEIYMLIDAGSEKEAKKFASELNGTYRSAQSGSCVIVFIFGIGTPNFAPFNQA